MNKIILFLLTTCLFFSCGNDSEKLIVQGNIKGLKKGTIYLKKASDSVVVTLDSITISGDSNFKLETSISNPEIFYLLLDKNDKTKDGIAFFGSKGVTEINTTLKNFTFDAKIKGSKQQDVLNKYMEMITKFNDQNLDLIKDNLNAKIGKDSLAIANSEKQLNSLTRRKYLYTTNFALTNKDSEVAPYLAITQLYDANIKLLDTINNSLPKNIKNSKYGVELMKFVKKIKTEEKN